MPEKRPTLPIVLRATALATELITHLQDIYAIASGLAALAGLSTIYGLIYGLIMKNGPVRDISLVSLSIIGSGLLIARAISNRHKKRDKEISEAFCKLQDAYLAFELQVIKIGYILAIEKESSLSLTKLGHLHLSYLQAICETAATTFNARKPFKRQIQANIKVLNQQIDSTGRVDYYVDVVARSNKTPRERIFSDRRLKLEENYMYERIFNRRLKEDYYIERNLAALLADQNFRKSEATEPNEGTLEYYASCMVHPIMGASGSLSEGTSDLLRYDHNDGTYDVFGLMGVDSKSKRAFKEDYDLGLIIQLTSYAFSSYRMARAIEDLAKEKKAVISRV
jgi:hypothetical protein